MRILKWLACLAALLAAPAIAAPAQPVEAWADALFEPALKTHRFTGAEIVVVEDGAVSFAKGYGLADPATGRAMDPAATEVRIGSTTKVITATAIAQLHEKGLIRSLDDPANRYLKRVQLPDWKGRPITIRHLLTHRGGFEDKAFGLGTDRAIAHPVSADVIARAMPKLVREPGTWSVYSNFGTAVLGLIVEDVSGQPIDRYFKAHIFAPLGMERSYLNLALSPSPAHARPYATFPDGARQAIGFVPMNPFIAPAGGVSTTGLDMARFMIAQIEGANGKPSILSAEGFRRMQTRHVANHPATTGFGMVFIEGTWNGAHVVEHGGGWPGFQTVMVLVPERGIGVFASIVGEAPVIDLTEQLRALVGKTRLAANPVEPVLNSAFVREAALTRFLGAYRPTEAPVTRPASDFAGTYCRQRRSYSTVEAAFDFLGAGYAVITAAAGADGTLTIRGVPGYRQVAPGVFFNPDAAPQALGDPNTSALFAFTARNGKATGMAPLLSVDAWERCSDSWNPRTLGMMLPVLLLTLFTGILCLFWPGSTRAERLARWLPLLQLGTVIALPLVLLGFYAADDGIMYHVLQAQPERFIGLAIAGNVGALVAVLTIAAAVAAWLRGWWGEGRRALFRRVHFSLIAIAAAGILAFLASLNLVGWNLP
ncbi:serine hydrolase domain-containing protein [Sphingosinicella sp.]|uniref:serine hydrolase domain-containing protein n=1 Tax=Sphingosinicella sp. TaxID=1917971 RepID=UPI0017999219|nr:serine hydrolase domain-containing protein [Sphingosinicella sp.]MBA4758726.1 beta-lactamase family protein [Sphingosinicella sp.]